MPDYLLKPPATLAIAKVGCWKCHKKTRVIAIYSDNILEYYNFGKLHETNSETFFPYVFDISSPLNQQIQLHFPFYYKSYSKTINATYYMNHCEHCKAAQGDFFLFDGINAVFGSDFRGSRFLIEMPVQNNVNISAPQLAFSSLVMNTLAGVNHNTKAITIEKYLSLREQYFKN